jgi:hypothetical protein
MRVGQRLTWLTLSGCQSRRPAFEKRTASTTQPGVSTFQRRECPMEEFTLKGRKIGGPFTEVEYCIVHPSVWRPCRARRRDGEIPAVKRRAEP